MKPGSLRGVPEVRCSEKEVFLIFLDEISPKEKENEVGVDRL